MNAVMSPAWKTVLLVVWRFAKSRPALVIVAVLGALYFGGIWSNSRQQTVIHVRPPVSRAKPAPETKDWPKTAIPCPEGGIVAQKPTGAAREAVAEEFSRPDLLTPRHEELWGDQPIPIPTRPGGVQPHDFEREIISLVLVPKMPEGGKALISSKVGTGKIDVDFKPNPWVENPQPKRGAIGLPGQWGFGVLGGTDDYQGWEWSKVESWNAYAFIEPLRTGSLYWRLQAGRQQLFGQQGNYVMVGAEWRRR